MQMGAQVTANTFATAIVAILVWVLKIRYQIDVPTYVSSAMTMVALVVVSVVVSLVAPMIPRTKPKRQLKRRP
jgi:hypothetical protein